MKNQRGSLHIVLLGVGIVLIMGGLFFILTAKKPDMQPTSMAPIESISPTAMPTLSSSDEITAIDQDLQTTEVTQDDPEMKSIESDLNSL